eukprot:jgi/Picre1/28411/NNA_003816.t1
MKGKDKTSKSRAGRRARRQLSLRLLAKALAQRDIEKQNKETIRRQNVGASGTKQCESPICPRIQRRLKSWNLLENLDM